MARLIIQGGHRLSGVHRTPGNKNAALPMLAASVLTSEPVTLRNLPLIDDVFTMLEILEANDAPAAIACGGDLASDCLQRGYDVLDGVTRTASRHASVLGAVLLETSVACTERGGTAWARILGTGAAGDWGGVQGAVGRALEAADAAGACSVNRARPARVMPGAKWRRRSDIVDLGNSSVSWTGRELERRHGMCANSTRCRGL